MENKDKKEIKKEKNSKKKERQKRNLFWRSRIKNNKFKVNEFVMKNNKL